MAGLGFAVDESSAFKNKQGKGQDLVGAIAGTDAVNKIAGSPAAATVGFLGEGATRGAALPIAATMDVLNKGVNAAGQFFGFNPGLSTDNTARVSNMSVPQSAAVPTTARPSRTPGGFVPTMAPSRTPGEVVDVDPTRGKLGGMFGFNKEGAAAPGGDTMLLGGAGARSYQTPMYAADIAKSLGVTDPARMAKNDWSDGSVNQKLAMQQADNAVAHERHLRNQADVEKLRNNRSLQEHFNELLYSRNTLGMPQSAMWELAGKNFAAQQDRNKIAGDLEAERIKGEFGMKAKADDLESRRLDREAERKSALEVAALKAKESRETDLGVAKLKMDESRTERELAAEKELRKGKVELAVPDATKADTDIETAIAAREMGLEARGVKKNMFGSITEPAGFYDKKTGKLIDAATIKGMRGKMASVPAGYTQIGTSGGKPVYQDAQGKKFIGA